MQITNLVGLVLLSLAPSLVSADWYSEELAIREAYPQGSDYYGELAARDAEAEADAYYADLYARDTYANVYARDAEPDFNWAEYQALKRRHAFQKRGKITKKQVDDAEKAIEQKQTQIETAESQYKRMTEGPNKVALASTIRKMKNSESQLKARHERLDDEYKRGKR